MVLSNWEITLRLLLAALYGCIIGLERHHNGKPVGSRTHAIICVSGAMIAIIGMCGFVNMDDFTRDPTRLPVGVLTGLGFLGAGVIWQDKGGVKGLTTAATIYTTACIGLTVGFGYYYLATLGTLLVFFILTSGKIVNRLDKKNRLEKYINNPQSQDSDKASSTTDNAEDEENVTAEEKEEL